MHAVASVVAQVSGLVAFNSLSSAPPELCELLDNKASACARQFDAPNLQSTDMRSIRHLLICQDRTAKTMSDTAHVVSRLHSTSSSECVKRSPPNGSAMIRSFTVQLSHACLLACGVISDHSLTARPAMCVLNISMITVTCQQQQHSAASKWR